MRQTDEPRTATLNMSGKDGLPFRQDRSGDVFRGWAGLLSVDSTDPPELSPVHGETFGREGLCLQTIENRQFFRPEPEER